MPPTSGGTSRGRRPPTFMRAMLLLALLMSARGAFGFEMNDEPGPLRCRLAGPPVRNGGTAVAPVVIMEGPRTGGQATARCPRKYADVLRTGDVCLVRFSERGAEILEPLRQRTICFLVGLLAVCVIATMGARGARVLGSIGLALVLVVFVLLPLTLRGGPVVPVAGAIAAVLCSAGMLLVGGWSRKSLYAAVGALLALGAAAWFPVVAARLLTFTGLEVEFGTFFHLDVPLWYSPALAKVDYHQLLLAGMLIASLGATMDAAMSVSTAVWEVKLAAPSAGRRHLLQAGLAVGRDVMSMMIFAIVLVYAGYRFEMLLLFHIRGLPYAPGLLLNYEEIAVEVIHMICTALALGLSIPATALVAAHFLGRTDEPKNT